ncbi:unnamed protein product [Citrullus colocynthis]|uniref:Uncharacterized protein n=1 Tax=Citrullus colocynthis TaxID=252529 RepID=A0ABP0YY07_9ROSI
MTGTTRTTTATTKLNIGTAKSTSGWKQTTATKSPIQRSNPVRVSGSRSWAISGWAKARGSNRTRLARARGDWSGQTATGRTGFERSEGNLKDGGSWIQQEEASAFDGAEESELETVGGGGGFWGRPV